METSKPWKHFFFPHAQASAVWRPPFLIFCQGFNSCMFPSLLLMSSVSLCWIIFHSMPTGRGFSDPLKSSLTLSCSSYWCIVLLHSRNPQPRKNCMRILSPFVSNFRPLRFGFYPLFCWLALLEATSGLHIPIRTEDNYSSGRCSLFQNLMLQNFFWPGLFSSSFTLLTPLLLPSYNYLRAFGITFPPSSLSPPERLDLFSWLPCVKPQSECVLWTWDPHLWPSAWCCWSVGSQASQSCHVFLLLSSFLSIIGKWHPHQPASQPLRLPPPPPHASHPYILPYPVPKYSSSAFAFLYLCHHSLFQPSWISPGPPQQPYESDLFSVLFSIAIASAYFVPFYI